MVGIEAVFKCLSLEYDFHEVLRLTRVVQNVRSSGKVHVRAPHGAPTKRLSSRHDVPSSLELANKNRKPSMDADVMEDQSAGVAAQDHLIPNSTPVRCLSSSTGRPSTSRKSSAVKPCDMKGAHDIPPKLSCYRAPGPSAGITSQPTLRLALLSPRTRPRYRAAPPFLLRGIHLARTYRVVWTAPVSFVRLWPSK